MRAGAQISIRVWHCQTETCHLDRPTAPRGQVRDGQSDSVLVRLRRVVSVWWMLHCRNGYTFNSKFHQQRANRD
jgi:hypothetical protein